MTEKSETSPNQSLTDIVTSAAFILILLLLAVIGTSMYFRARGEGPDESVRSLNVRIDVEATKNVEFQWEVTRGRRPTVSEPESQTTSGSTPWFFSIQRVDDGEWEIATTPTIPLLDGNAVVERASAVAAHVNSNRPPGSRNQALWAYQESLGGKTFGANATPDEIQRILEGLFDNNIDVEHEVAYLRYTLSRHILKDEGLTKLADHVQGQFKSTGRRDPEKLIILRLIDLEEKVRAARAVGQDPEGEVWRDFDQRRERAISEFAQGILDPSPFRHNRHCEVLRFETVRARLMKEYYNREYKSPLSAEFCDRYRSVCLQRPGDPLLIATSLELARLFAHNEQVGLHLEIKSGSAPVFRPKPSVRLVPSSVSGQQLPVARIRLAEPDAPPEFVDLWGNGS